LGGARKERAVARRLPDSLSDCHALIRRLRRRVRSVESALEQAGDYAYRLLDDREFLAEQLDLSRSLGTTRLGYYGRISDPFINCPEDVP
jgi:hypothetical protein